MTVTSRSTVSCVSGSVCTSTQVPPVDEGCKAAAGTRSTPSCDSVTMDTLAVMPGFRRGSGSGMSSSTA